MLRVTPLAEENWKGEKTVKIKLDKGAFMPERAHEWDAGLDLRAMEDKVVPARGSAIFDTGVHIQLPPFTAGLIVSKSGLNFKHDIQNDGLIDIPYRGSIKIKLYNHGDTDYMVHRGDKISQLVIVDIRIPHLKVVDELEETERGNNGFGSTGR